jgi:hypothetical protein
MRTDVTHRRVERVHHVEQAHASRAARERDFARHRVTGSTGVEREGGCGVARLEHAARNGELDVAFEGFVGADVGRHRVIGDLCYRSRVRIASA